MSQTQTYKTWSGYAFENLCLKHIPQIKKALNISGIYSLSSVFHHKGSSNQKGKQIDLLIDRNDEAINLIETKFYKAAFPITKSVADQLQQKEQVFKTVTKTQKQIFWVLIAPFGVQDNEHSRKVLAKVLGLVDLFGEG